MLKACSEKTYEECNSLLKEIQIFMSFTVVLSKYYFCETLGL